MLLPEKSDAQFFYRGRGVSVSVGGYTPFYGGYSPYYGGYSPYYQNSWGWYGPAYRYGGYYSTPVYGSYYTMPTYSTYYQPSAYTVAPMSRGDSVMTTSSGVTTTQSFYPPTSGGNQAAILNIHVPDVAEIWFEGEKTNQTGADRVFRSPPLAEGQNYSYDVKARWMEDGKPVEKTRTVRIKAGEQVRINFMEAAEEKLPLPRQ